MKRAALYARVSTDRTRQDPELQLRELRQHCERQGWTIVHEYVDEVSSARVRPNLEQMLADAMQHQFDAVLVWKFDRVARSAIELCGTLEQLTKLNVNFVSLTEQIDTSTPAGKLVFTVLGAVAEMERSLIRERVRAGLRNARAKGVKLGPPRRIFISAEAGRDAIRKYGTLRAAAAVLKVSHMWLRKLVKTP